MQSLKADFGDHLQKKSAAFWWKRGHHKTTLPGTNISPPNVLLKMIFLFLRWDMLVSWRVSNSSAVQRAKFLSLKKMHHEQTSQVNHPFAMQRQQIESTPSHVQRVKCMFQVTCSSSNLLLSSTENNIHKTHPTSSPMHHPFVDFPRFCALFLRLLTVVEIRHHESRNKKKLHSAWPMVQPTNNKWAEPCILWNGVGVVIIGVAVMNEVWCPGGSMSSGGNRYVCMYVCMYVRINTYVYIYICICTRYIYTLFLKKNKIIYVHIYRLI